MARTVVRKGVRPEVVLTSTAVRAKETAKAFAKAFDAEVTELAELYLADPAQILASARAAGMDEIMVVAHDPGMSALVSRLADRDERMVTCAVAIFTWHDGTWDDVDATPPDEFELLTP